VDFGLRGNLDYLALLGREWASGALDDESFQRRADAYVADHRELIDLTRVGADFVIRDVAPLEGNSQIVGLRLTLPEPARASSEAKRSRQAVYTRPFEAIQGKPSFEVWLPVFRGDEFLGLLAGVYSIEGLLRHVVAPVATGRHLHLLDSSGTVFAETGRHPTSDDTGRAVTSKFRARPGAPRPAHPPGTRRPR